MRVSLAAGLASAVLVGLVASFAGPKPAAADEDRSRALVASLHGWREDGGDADVFGRAIITLLPNHERLCYALVVGNLDSPATAAHIYRVVRGDTDPAVVTLKAPNSEGRARGCLVVSHSWLLEDLADNPSDYYVQVHDEAHPHGVARGALFGVDQILELDD